MTAYRYAIFFAPRCDSEMWQWGSAWVGRDARTDRTVPQPVLSGIGPEQLRRITSVPRRYGFHGTLKPPFRLAHGTTRGALRAAVAEFAGRQKPFRLGPLNVSKIGRFLALTPVEGTGRIDRLAADIVHSFEPFRGPPTEAELARRRRAGLSARQDALLRRWGYPFVLEEFRFHMTLTGPVSEHERALVCEAVEERFAQVLAQPLMVDCLWLFEQPCAGAAFRAVEQHRLGVPSAVPDTATQRAAHRKETAIESR